MNIKHESIKRFFFFLTFFYYMGFLSFITGMFGGKGDDAFAANATGSIANQLTGICILLTCVILLTHAKITRSAEFIRHFFIWGLLILWFVLSINWSYAPHVSFRRVVAFSIMVLAAYCLVQIFTPRSLLVAFVVSTGLAASLGLVEALISPSDAFIREGIRAGAFSGMYFDKNGGARVYAYGLLTLIGLGLYKYKLGVVIFTLLSICLLLSKSVTALVMVVSGTALITMFKVLHSTNHQRNLVRFFTILIVLAFTTTIVIEAFEFILTVLGRSPNLTNRTVIWELMNTYVEAEFIKGYGFGAFWASDAVKNFMDRWGYIGNAHSGYYEALLHGGVICLLIVITIIIHGLFLLIYNYIKGTDISTTSVLTAIFILQTIVNYIGYLITNHNSVDMFIFLIAYFISFSIYDDNISRKKSIR